MKRLSRKLRQAWRTTVESQGLVFNTNADGTPYWDESACYEFTERDVLQLEKATNDLYQMCLQAGQAIIDRDLFDRFRIPRQAVPLIRRAWENEPPSIYGRFDLAFDGVNPPKLLEFNADTPTALLEAAVIQWYWQQDEEPGADQFNSIHERLVAKWKELKSYMKGPILHLTSVRDSVEDEMTCAYVADCADQAGITTRFLYVDDIGWNGGMHRFMDLEDQPITDLFKLYPWEWLTSPTEEFSQHVSDVEDAMQWVEPIWKMMWSNKALLALLYEMFPHHPNILPAFLDGPGSLDTYVKKPILAREGANVTIVTDQGQVSSAGTYGQEGYVWQQYVPLPDFAGNHPVVGSWLIDGVSAGIGIRESTALITSNESRFVPHYFRKG
jgi:glutathionylspermidine synthase